ncbi:MAG: hypothetical protein WC455_23565 [Dehalococcoidia bacterium]|jgi:hypothetical protein
MNATVKMVAVIGLVLIVGFACGYLFAGATAPVPQAKAIIVEVVSYSSDSSGEMIAVTDDNQTLSVDTAGLQLGTNTTFVRENKIESWGITLHNI